METIGATPSRMRIQRQRDMAWNREPKRVRHGSGTAAGAGERGEPSPRTSWEFPVGRHETPLHVAAVGLAETERGLDVRERRGWLSAREQATLALLRGDHRSCEWLAGRLAAKLAAVGAAPGTHPTEIEIVPPAEPNQAMMARVARDGRTAFVSISHSGAWAVAVASADRRCGIDLELCRWRQPSVYRRAVAGGWEAFAIGLVSPPLLRCVAFAAVWTVKEAVLKTRGLGLAYVEALPLERWTSRPSPASLGGRPQWLVGDPIRLWAGTLDVGGQSLGGASWIGPVACLTIVWAIEPSARRRRRRTDTRRWSQHGPVAAPHDARNLPRDEPGECARLTRDACRHGRHALSDNDLDPRETTQ